MVLFWHKYMEKIMSKWANGFNVLTFDWISDGMARFASFNTFNLFRYSSKYLKFLLFQRLHK